MCSMPTTLVTMARRSSGTRSQWLKAAMSCVRMFLPGRSCRYSYGPMMIFSRTGPHVAARPRSFVPSSPWPPPAGRPGPGTPLVATGRIVASEADAPRDRPGGAIQVPSDTGRNTDLACGPLGGLVLLLLLLLGTSFLGRLGVLGPATPGVVSLMLYWCPPRFVELFRGGIALGDEKLSAGMVGAGFAGAVVSGGFAADFSGLMAGTGASEGVEDRRPLVTVEATFSAGAELFAAAEVPLLPVSVGRDYQVQKAQEVDCRRDRCLQGRRASVLHTSVQDKVAML